MLEKYMDVLGKELEVDESMATQVPGVYTLPIAENLSVTLTDAPPNIRLSCILGPAKKQNEEAFYTRLMLGNLFGQGTKGAILGLNNDGTLLTLTQSMDYNVSYKEFKEILEDFINSIEYWQLESTNYK